MRTDLYGLLFSKINEFISHTLGMEAQQRYKIIINDPAQVAREIKAGIDEVHNFRRETSDAFYFNWLLKVEDEFQRPFVPTHENMLGLDRLLFSLKRVLGVIWGL